MADILCVDCGEENFPMAIINKQWKCTFCRSGGYKPNPHIREMAPDSMLVHKPKMTKAEYMNLKTRKTHWDGRVRPDKRWR